MDVEEGSKEGNVRTMKDAFQYALYSAKSMPTGVVRWAALDNTLLQRNVMRSDELVPWPWRTDGS